MHDRWHSPSTLICLGLDFDSCQNDNYLGMALSDQLTQSDEFGHLLGVHALPQNSHGSNCCTEKSGVGSSRLTGSRGLCYKSNTYVCRIVVLLPQIIESNISRGDISNICSTEFCCSLSPPSKVESPKGSLLSVLVLRLWVG